MTLRRTYSFCALPRRINPIAQRKPRNWRKIGQHINCKSFKNFDILFEVFNIGTSKFGRISVWKIIEAILLLRYVFRIIILKWTFLRVVVMWGYKIISRGPFINAVYLKQQYIFVGLNATVLIAPFRRHANTIYHERLLKIDVRGHYNL